MQLQAVPNKTLIKVKNNVKVPPEGIKPEPGERLFFYSLKGKYSICRNKKGQPVHLPYWTDVDIIYTVPEHKENS